MNRRTTTTLALVLAPLAGSLAVLSGCRGDREEKPPRQFFPDMDEMPRWNAQGHSEFFRDGRMLRQPVKGTVPFGGYAMSADVLTSTPEALKPFLADREERLKADPALFTGRDSAGQYLKVMPAAPDMATVLRGQQKFDTYCAICHGYTGDGKGMVGNQWAYALPSFYDPKYRSGDPSDPKSVKHYDGFLFHTARYGVPNEANPSSPKMPGYAHALTERDAWAVVAYIRALQSTMEGSATDLPEVDRQRIDSQRPPAKSAAGNGAAGKSANGGTP